MDFKKTDAPLETVTYDRNIVDAQTDNIYEAISIISKRTIQINESIKKELLDKLEEFASPTESLDEIFENKEQIEVSKFYEKLPKAHAMAIENWLKETKDPMTTINETIQNTSEVIKRLPEFPEIMDKANQALTYLASGQIPQNSNSYTALNNAKSEMVAFRNQSIIGILVVVIIGLLVF